MFEERNKNNRPTVEEKVNRQNILSIAAKKKISVQLRFAFSAAYALFLHSERSASSKFMAKMHL